MLDTPGQVPRNEDQLGCGPGQTVSDAEEALDQRLTELRAPTCAAALYVNGDLLLAARDIALRLQGGMPAPADLPDFLATFGYHGEAQALVLLAGSSGIPSAPADPSVLITSIPMSDAKRLILADPSFNEGAATVFGSCYELGAVVLLAKRVAAPGPNP